LNDNTTEQEMEMLSNHQDPVALTLKSVPQSSSLSEEEEDEPSCPVCGGPLYTKPMWRFTQCDDCGHTMQKADWNE